MEVFERYINKLYALTNNILELLLKINYLNLSIYSILTLILYFYLQGNWLEELALEASTGIRYYPSPQKKDGSLMTQSRVISHTDHLNPKDYKSTMTLTILDPHKHSEHINQKDRPLGPRSKLMEEKIRAQVEEEFNQKTEKKIKESKQGTYITSTNTAHGITGFKPCL
jgi:hypothetical protein